MPLKSAIKGCGKHEREKYSKWQFGKGYHLATNYPKIHERTRTKGISNVRKEDRKEGSNKYQKALLPVSHATVWNKLGPLQKRN